MAQDKKKASHRRVAAQLLKHVFENTSRPTAILALDRSIELKSF